MHLEIVGLRIPKAEFLKHQLIFAFIVTQANALRTSGV